MTADSAKSLVLVNLSCQDIGILVKLSAKENYITSSLGLLTMMDPGIGLIHGNSRIYHYIS